MRTIYLLIFALITFGSGVLIAKHHYEPSNEELQEEFKRYGQYAPEYINYTDDQMLYVCEAYKLVYSFENAECV